MTDHFTALTSLILQILLRIKILLLVVLVIDLVLDLVLLYLATLLVLAFFAAAPPDEGLGVVLTPMDVATPIEVRVFVELFVAVLASFDAYVNFAFSTPELDDARTHLLLLVG